MDDRPLRLHPDRLDLARRPADPSSAASPLASRRSASVPASRPSKAQISSIRSLIVSTLTGRALRSARTGEPAIAPTLRSRA